MAVSDVEYSESEYITHATIDADEHIIVHYRFVPGPNLTLEEAAVRVAIMTSLKTLKPVFYESAHSRNTYAGKVIHTDSESGEVIIAYPLSLCSETEGITQLLMLLFTGCEYSYTEKFWVQKIEMPNKFLARFSGPQFGIDGIRERFSIPSRPLVGTVVKPRNGIQINDLYNLLFDSLIGGADFLVDDVLLVDPDGSMCFKNRIQKLTQLVRDASAKTRETKLYICNVSAPPQQAIKMAKLAKSEGAGGLVVNTFAMGYPFIQEMSGDPDINLPLITTNFGIGMLTHPGLPTNTRFRPNGASEELMALLGRLVGTDGGHVGTSGTDCAAKDAWGPAVMSLRTKLHGIKPCFSIAEGDLTIADIWANIYSLGSDFMIETCTGIFNYPGGPENGAYAFRKLLEEINYRMHPSQAHNRIMDLAQADPIIKSGLEFYDYKPLEGF